MKAPIGKSKTYHEKYLSLIERYLKLKSLLSIENIPEKDFVDWLINDVRPSLLPNSWRVYRNSVISCIESEEEKDRLLKTKSLNTKKTQSALYKPRTKRDKGISDDDLLLIEDWLINKSKSQYSKALLIWLKSTIATGLRPHEWLSARLETSDVVQGSIALVCVNDKSTKDQHGFMSSKGYSGSKTHQTERTIDLSHLEGTNTLHLIKTQIGIMEEVKSVIASGVEENFFDKFYTNLANTMNNCTRGCLGEREKYPTIYSARHQFASNVKANLKKQGTPTEKARRILAVLMGQGSPKTSTYNYGLTSKGDPDTNIPLPNESEYKIATGESSFEEESHSK